MERFGEIANRIEAGIWFVVALILLVRALRSEQHLKRIIMILSGSFIVFGISDLIEAKSGAWWQPLWLLFLKAVCLILFFFGFRAYFRAMKPGSDNFRPTN